jgi:hypothetical protein
MKSGADWSAVDIGMKVPVSAEIRTGPDGTCELQFGEIGSVQLSPNSALAVRSLVADAKHTASELELTTGKVVCKVRKLSGDDQFRVRTREMVCGVRGTKFLVSASADAPTKIAVTEGSVAILPPSIDPVALAESQTDDAKKAVVNAVIEQVTRNAPLLSAGQEVVVSSASMAAVAAPIQEIVAKIDTAQSADDVSALVANYRTAVESKPVKMVPVSKATKVDFERAANLEIRDVAPDAGASSSGSSAQTGSSAAVSAALTAVSIVAEPADAVISINNVNPSKGNFSALYAPGETLSIQVVRDGYATYSESLTVAADPVVKSVKLETSASSGKNAPTVAAAKPAPVVEETKPVTSVFDVSSLKLLFAVVKGGKLVSSDAKSAVAVTDLQGKKLWSAATANGTNTNSQPVVAQSSVLFAGEKTLSSYDLSSGAELWSVALDKSTSCLFGRRPVVSGDRIYTTSNEGLVVLDLSTGKSAGSVPFADGSDMTPAVSGKNLYVVTKTGTFLTISLDTLAVTSKLETGAVQPVATAPVINGQTAYFADRKGSVFAVKLDASSVVWQKKLNNDKAIEVYGDPVISGSALFITAKGSLYALATATGDPLFSALSGVTTPALPVGKSVWCGRGSALVSLNPADGSVLREIPTPAAVSGRLALSGTVIAAPLADGKMFTLDTATAK